MELIVRPATMADVPELTELIRASVRGLQDEYTPEQRERALEMVFGVDTQLVADGTYLVVEALSGSQRSIAGCGGWSRRKTLFGHDHCAGREDTLLDPARDAAKIRAFFVHPAWARRGVGSRLLDFCERAARAEGYRSLEMAATLPGIPLYRARGYFAGEPREVPLGPGLSLTVVHMQKSIA